MDEKWLRRRQAKYDELVDSLGKHFRQMDQSSKEVWDFHRHIVEKLDSLPFSQGGRTNEADMDDLTITRLCAEAMGYKERDDSADEFIDGIPPDGMCVKDASAAPIRQVFYFNPLHDDAQAMALVKKFNLSIEPGFAIGAEWNVYAQGQVTSGVFQDLNRAICECVAKMQSAK